ncbi:10401_t:CDS:2 [Funneliformis geosporum]|uniref:10401_t:CDS:1 n=1 Tax=Funneliformis geosporum TaxID=1117311 RepID=A0A9W4WNJ5_9GLOM|nr:10401_t:CDS:2 [Funneliformis geosporum]
MSVDKPNSEQAWFKSWIKTRNIRLEDSVPNITNTREQLLQSHKLLQDLRSKLNNLKEIRESANENEWKVNIESLENVKKTLESNFSSIDQQFIEKVKFKLSKTRRHKKLQSVRDERQRRRETLHKTIDEWRTEWIAKELALKRVKKVKKLRDLRRERLKREGHFFPEEDDEFFNRISTLNDAMKVEEARLNQERDAAAEHKRNEAMDAGMKERERERDPVYEYWHQAEFDLDNLVSIRRQWDAYIDETGSVGSSCIPPTFVNPSPPANYIWASCLMHGSP